MKTQYYNLYSPNEDEPVLAYGYECTDLDGKFVFGFNIHDGGGVVLLSDLAEGTRIKPVEIREI